MGRRGFDIGTYNLVCARRDEESIKYKREVNGFLEMPLENRFVFNMMKNAGVPLIEHEENNVAYALGEAAVNMSYTMNQIQLRRPMKDGCLNPKEKSAQQIMNIMVHSLIGEVENDGEILYYSVPANAINEETDAEYHSKVLEAIFKAYESSGGKKVDPYPINEALALVYAELQDKAWTGVGVSCLCPKTKVYTKRGIINIEDISINDMVLTHKGRWRNVNRIIEKDFSGIATKFTITGWSNNPDDYKFVDNHELLVLRNEKWEWIGCEELVEGDVVGEPYEVTSSNRDVITMTICERITCSSEYTKKHIEVSPNILRLIGYFLADGSVSRSENCIQFDFHINETNYISDVKEILYRYFGKETSLVKHGDNCTRVKCYSKGLANYFSNKFYDESHNKIFPWPLEKLNKGGTISLLAGLIRGDGWYNDEQITFSNTSSHLSHLVKRLFSKLGVPSSLSYRNPRHGGIIEGRQITGKEIEWQVSAGNKCNLHGLINTIDEIDCDNSRHAERIFIRDGMCCGRISNIIHEEYEGKVYDIQVEEDHSFSGPMLTIHNCGAGMINVCMAIFGAPVFQFSMTGSGDYIDKMASKACGEETTSYVNKEKLKTDLTVENPPELAQRAIKAQYEIMIQKTISGIKKGIEQAGNKARTEHPVDVVIAGGTSSPKGFPELFTKIWDASHMPIDRGKIIRPKEPLFSVAKGCLIAAENHK